MAKALAALLGAALLVLSTRAATAQETHQETHQQTRSHSGAALRLGISGPIGPATSEYVRHGLQEARRRQAEAVVLTLDTPGGLDSAMRDIIGAIIQSPVPVISYVSPTGARAASAGTYILYASHVAAMAPSTHLGAATPVQLGGFGGGDGRQKGENDKAPPDAHAAKAINDAVAYIRSLAELRGRNAEWGEKAVREAATLTASQAEAIGVIDIVATDLPDLLRKADGRVVRAGEQAVTLTTKDLPVQTLEPDWRNRILATITNPTVAYLLMLVGAYGLLFEFISPGAVVPGVLGGIALLVGLYGLNFLPVSYAGAGLLLFGIALMTAEAFLPSFGIVGIGGIVAFAIGSLFLLRGDIPGFQLSWPVVAATTAASAAVLIIALAAVWRAHRRHVATGDPQLLGSAGKVLSWSGLEGEVHVHGERWHARAAAVLSPGQGVRIAARENLTLLVEPEPGCPPPT